MWQRGRIEREETEDGIKRFIKEGKICITT